MGSAVIDASSMIASSELTSSIRIGSDFKASVLTLFDTIHFLIVRKRNKSESVGMTDEFRVWPQPVSILKSYRWSNEKSFESSVTGTTSEGALKDIS